MFLFEDWNNLSLLEIDAKSNKSNLHEEKMEAVSVVASGVQNDVWFFFPTIFLYKHSTIHWMFFNTPYA